MSPAAPTDAELIEACLAGNERAWSRLVDRYENLVYSVPLNVGLGADDAGDVFQYVWTELFRSLPRLRNATALPRWLMVAARRHSFKVARRRRRFGGELSTDLVDPKTLPDQVVLEMEDRRLLETALEKMRESDSLLLRMLFLQVPRPSYDEISERTGLAVGSIGPIRARCLQRLRKLLEEPS